MFTVYGSACQQLERDHAALLAADRENSRVLNNRQAVSPLGTCSCTRQQTDYYAHLILPVNFFASVCNRSLAWLYTQAAAQYCRSLYKPKHDTATSLKSMEGMLHTPPAFADALIVASFAADCPGVAQGRAARGYEHSI